MPDRMNAIAKNLAAPLLKTQKHMDAIAKNVGSPLLETQKRMDAIAKSVASPLLEAQKQMNAVAKTVDFSALLEAQKRMDAIAKTVDFSALLEAQKQMDAIQSAHLGPMLEAAKNLRSLSQTIDFAAPSSFAAELRRTMPDAQSEVNMPQLDAAIFRDHKLDALVDLKGALAEVADLLENQSHFAEQLLNENRLLRLDQQDLRDTFDQGRRENRHGTVGLLLVTFALLVVALISAPSIIHALSAAWHWLFG